MTAPETVHLEKPDGELLTVHGPDMGQVRRLCERGGCRRLGGRELRDRLETTDATHPEVHDGHS